MEIKEYREYREDEILKLYSEAGWTAYTQDPETLRRGYEHSLLVLAARENGKLLGIIRAVGDGATIVFIQDVIVAPHGQRKGIGTALVKALLDRFPGVRQIELAADDTPWAAAFYRSLGFSEMSELGCCGFMKCR